MLLVYVFAIYLLSECIPTYKKITMKQYAMPCQQQPHIIHLMFTKFLDCIKRPHQVTDYTM
jgi:hypothetical protein